MSDDLHDPKGLARGPRADQSLRGLSFCLAVWQPRPAVRPLDPPETLGLEFLGQISHPLSTSFQLVWQMKRLHRLPERTVAGTALGGIKSSRRGGYYHHYSLNLRPPLGASGGYMSVNNRGCWPGCVSTEAPVAEWPTR